MDPKFSGNPDRDPPMNPSPATDPYVPARARLIARIEAEAHATAFYTGRARFAPAVLAALGRVPRHRFVPEGLEDQAYLNEPLSIGYGQTISQPYIVALMTDLLDLPAQARVLEIGCGSGYQAAVLAELGAQVYSIEFVEALADAARERLARLGYGTVSVRCGDGYDGWPEQAPYDGILVTAATPEIPPPLLEQLKPGGRLVIPLGPPWEGQDLTVVIKAADGSLERRSVLPVAFVPFLRRSSGLPDKKTG
jgi:protein-L-isoaspartate(D-aspartate) O-methyltransferase